MTIITLTTDFGLRSGFAGVMQGEIYSLAPQVKIVDLTHFISPRISGKAHMRYHGLRRFSP